MFGFGRLLARVRPSGTTNETALIAGAPTEITRFVVSNVSANARAFRIFHDDLSTTFDASTALYYDVAIAANTTLILPFGDGGPGTGLFVATAGTIQVRSDAADDLVFHLYGGTAALGPRRSA